VLRDSGFRSWRDIYSSRTSGNGHSPLGKVSEIFFASSATFAVKSFSAVADLALAFYDSADGVVLLPGAIEHALGFLELLGSNH
jgi:hypothetical protein